jgi:hypothetical protein
MPVRHLRAHRLGHVQGRAQRPFLVATGAQTPLLATQGDEQLVPAIRTAHPGKALLQIAAAQKRLDHLIHDRPPIAVAFLIPQGIHGLEGREVFLEQLMEGRAPRLARGALDTGSDCLPLVPA